MKHLGEADIILSIKILRSCSRLMLSQSYYIEKILRKFGHIDNSLELISYDFNTLLRKNMGSIAQLEYAREIGHLTYLPNCTSLDIACVVGRLSRYTQNPYNIY